MIASRPSFDVMTSEEIIDDFPKLNKVDIQACLSYAADREQNQLILSQ